MKYVPLIAFLFVAAVSCTTDNSNKFIDKIEVNSCEDTSTFNKFSITIDSAFLSNYTVDSLNKIDPCKGCIVDQNHEGYPRCLSNQNYFSFQVFQLSPCFNLKIILTYPLEHDDIECNSFRSIYLVSYVFSNKQVDQILIGKIKSFYGVTELITSSIENNLIRVNYHEKWTAANGTQHDEKREERYIINKSAKFIKQKYGS